jgi:hypothetical protein
MCALELSAKRSRQTTPFDEMLADDAGIGGTRKAFHSSGSLKPFNPGRFLASAIGLGA